MRLEQLGWNSYFSQYATDLNSIPGRISEANRGIYRVLCEQGEFLAQMRGRIRFHAQDHSEFPAVGDWVMLKLIGEGSAIIEWILPRKTSLSRKSAGRSTERQIVCANTEYVFVVTSVNHDFNCRRLERYLTVAWESGSQPIIILTKADLCVDSEPFIREAENTAPGVPIFLVSAVNGSGMTIFPEYLNHGRTGVFIGSSGVGKSTIINWLCNEEIQRTAPVLESDDRGVHTTTSRQMILLNGGGIVIDTPGMRELGLRESISGLTQTFQDVESLAEYCKFRDCSHRNEPGCAVRDSEVVSAERLESYHKLNAEMTYLESKTNLSERLKRKAYVRQMSKAQKEVYKRKGR